MKTRAAFTLIELLVVVSIIGIIAAIALPVMASAKSSARQVAEVSAGRQLVAAYLAHATENNGELMPGYASLPAQDERGTELKNPVANRYPWRLAPYLNYELEVLYGKTGTERLTADRNRQHAEYAYAVSVSPAFGINGVFVGGDSQLLNPASAKATAAYGDFCVRRLAQAVKPSQLIVFTTACFDNGDQRIAGYFRVEPPNILARRWVNSWSGDKSEAGAYGHVHFRYGGKAIAAMLDGHVQLLGFNELNDMRRWSNQAAELDRPDFILGQ
jgi:prepilin-type N-terminal cleavage/methylation domain-containing protein/prepilin-type processing-associated H-X9-DG protein